MLTAGLADCELYQACRDSWRWIKAESASIRGQRGYATLGPAKGLAAQRRDSSVVATKRHSVRMTLSFGC